MTSIFFELPRVFLIPISLNLRETRAPPGFPCRRAHSRTFRKDFCRPRTAPALAPALVGVILTGANNDGAHGIRLIKKHGGLTVAHDPETAEYPEMPRAAIDTGDVDKVLTLGEIGELFNELGTGRAADE